MIGRIVSFFGDPKFARPRRRLFYLVLFLVVVADFSSPASTPNLSGSACRAGRRSTASPPASC